jgi:hypothetical protein
MKKTPFKNCNAKNIEKYGKDFIIGFILKEGRYTANYPVQCIQNLGLIME